MPGKKSSKPLPDKKGLKSMKDFIHDFFNPPKFVPPTETRKVTVKKKKKKQGITPIQRQLMETNDFMKYNMEEFGACSSGGERALLAYHCIPEESTTIDRLWPTELMNKDSRLRRELSLKGKESFLQGDHEAALEGYNEAILYSSGKGLAHTLARRAAFLLQTEEHLLALRDLRVALEYGCLETELLDFLLDHHTQAPGEFTDIKVAKRLDRKYVTTYKDKKASRWIGEIRKALDEFCEIQKLDREEYKKAKARKLAAILKSIECAAQEDNLDVNFEAKMQDVPKISSPNLDYPAFSDAVTIVRNVDKGRYLVATRDIPVGEIVGVEEPICNILAPEKLENLTNHCLHCHVYTKAPIPCEKCCAVVFCSKDCRMKATQGYHRYECEMRLYELLPMEGKEMFGYFLALRAITQRNLDYFLDHREVFEVFLDLDEPMFPAGETYSSGDYKTLMNLITHVEEVPETMMMKNAVVSVFFLRFLQHGKYFKRHVPEKRKGDRSLHPIEQFILRLLHHLISVQCFNSEQLTNLSAERSQYDWEVIGTSINTTMALINHSCDPNTFRFNMNKTSVLISCRHIKAGEEVTSAYDKVQFFSHQIAKREYHLLKHYMFQCECLACVERWPVLANLEDELNRVPNFEQERAYVVHYGDKGKICDEIHSTRGMATFGLKSCEFAVAQEALDALSMALDKHVKKPHKYFVEAGEMAEKFAINQYCRLPLEAPVIEEEEPVVVKEQTSNETIESGSKTKKQKREAKAIVVEVEKETDGANMLIKNWESGEGTSASLQRQVKAREKSPTLRLFSTDNKDTTTRKKSVLDRLEDSQFAKSSPPEAKKVQQSKEKKDLADSMRRFSAREEMAERMAAFQPSKTEKGSTGSLERVGRKAGEGLGKVFTRSQSVNNRDCVRTEEEENITTKLPDIKLETILEPPLSPLLPPTTPGGFIYQTDAELEEKILREIDLNRKKVRERRAAERKRKELLNGEENMSPESRAILDKEREVQKSLGSKEEKLKTFIENQIKKEENLSEKEKQLQEMRARTQRLLESSRQKELEFEAETEAFNETLKVGEPKQTKKKSLKDKIISNASDKAKSMNEMAKAMKEEMRRKRQEEKKDEEDDLLAFLRKSHKEKADIYKFVDVGVGLPSRKTVHEMGSEVTNVQSSEKVVNGILPESPIPLDDQALQVIENQLETNGTEQKSCNESPSRQSYSVKGLRSLILGPSPPDQDSKKLMGSDNSAKPNIKASKTDKRKSFIDHIKPSFTKPHKQSNVEKEKLVSGEEEAREETEQEKPRVQAPLRKPDLPLSCTMLALVGELPDSLLDLPITAELLSEGDAAKWPCPELPKETCKSKEDDAHTNQDSMSERTQILLERSKQRELEFEEQMKTLNRTSKIEEPKEQLCTKLAPSHVSQPSLRASTFITAEPFSSDASTSQDETKIHDKAPEVLTTYTDQDPDVDRPRTGRLLRKKSLSENCLVAIPKMNGMVGHMTASQTFSRRGVDEAPVRNQVFERAVAEDEVFLGEQIQVNGQHWELELENNIRSIEQLARVVGQEQSTDSDSGGMHYSERWSQERGSLSPQGASPRPSRSPSRSPQPEGRRGGLPTGRKARSRGYASTESDQSDGDQRPNPRHHRRTTLSRRKSLSETSLLSNIQARQLQRENSQEVDAFGLPKLTHQVPKRSVSLIRDSLVAKKDMRPKSDTEVHQRSIRKDTRTTRREEFKAKFESGSCTSISSRVARSTTPYRPPQVDSAHLTKVKTKFEEVDPESCNLPFPNYRSKPPIPRCKPPPPPALF